MRMGTRLAAAVAAALVATLAPTTGHAGPPRAEVIHWWTSGSELAALKVIAGRYRAAGGIWIDTAIADNVSTRAVSIHRIIDAPPAAAQFNTSRQFFDLVDDDMLANIDPIARQYDWDTTLPEPIRNVIKPGSHYYAVPVGVHMPTWIWYSRSAFRKAGITQVPANMDELFAALDKLKAAGLTPLAHGGQPWQDNIVFMTVLASMGSRELYLSVYRDKNVQVLRSAAFTKALLAFKRLQRYTDKHSAGRRWNDTTALLLKGEAGVQIMGDWVKGEIVAAGQQPGVNIGCIAPFGKDAPVIVQADVFIFPKNDSKEVQAGQKLLAHIMAEPATQREFARLKGSTPLNGAALTGDTDACTRLALAMVKERAQHVGNGETYLSPLQDMAMTAVLSSYWNSDMSLEAARQEIIAALRP